MEQQWDFVGLNRPAWLDVPEFSELQAGSSFAAASAELARRLDHYHQLPKTQENTLEERASCLLTLQHWLEGLATEYSLRPWVTWLAEVASNKTAHIGALQTVLAQGWHQDDRLAEHHCAQTELVDLHWRPLILTQQRYFCPARGYHWGDYWQQSLDPSHRHLPHQHAEWQQRVAEGERLPPYILWLEQRSKVLHSHWMRYFTRQEQAEAQLQFNDGRLMNLRGRPLSCSDKQHFLFVIGLNGLIYAARDAPNLCHASFTRGQPVLASGILQAREGKITHLKFESGHYISGQDHWWQAIQLFVAAGLEWGENVRVTVWDRHYFVSRKLAPHDVDSQTAFLSALRLRLGSFESQRDYNQ